MLSLRAALADRGLSGCPEGLRGINKFYEGNALARASFGFSSLRAIIEALRWPKQIDYLGDHPADDNQDWQHNPDGLALDGQTWFFVTQDSLKTIPITTDMQGLGTYHFDNRTSPTPLGQGATYSLASSEPGQADNQIIKIYPPPGYHHIGGLAIQRVGLHQSVLYIPLQQGDKSLADLTAMFARGSGPKPPLIYALQAVDGQQIIDHDWQAEIPQPGDQAAWCAFDPVARRLYTSDFYNVGGPPGSLVDVYAVGSPGTPSIGVPVPGQPFTLTCVGPMQLFEADGITPVKLHRIQAGFVTERRHLYLVQDDGTGIVGFDLITAGKFLRYLSTTSTGPAISTKRSRACAFSRPYLRPT